MFWPRDSRDTSEGKEAGISKAKNRGFSHFEHFLHGMPAGQAVSRFGSAIFFFFFFTRDARRAGRV